MSWLGGNELLIILVIVLVLFGGAKVPQLMRGLGEGMREFKKATRENDETENKSLTTQSDTRV